MEGFGGGGGEIVERERSPGFFGGSAGFFFFGNTACWVSDRSEWERGFRAGLGASNRSSWLRDRGMVRTVVATGGEERDLEEEGEGCVASLGASLEVLRCRDRTGLPDVELTTAEE